MEDELLPNAFVAVRFGATHEVSRSNIDRSMKYLTHFFDGQKNKPKNKPGAHQEWNDVITINVGDDAFFQNEPLEFRVLDQASTMECGTGIA